jgi:hypothetical protein
MSSIQGEPDQLNFEALDLFIEVDALSHVKALQVTRRFGKRLVAGKILGLVQERHGKGYQPLDPIAHRMFSNSQLYR